MAAGQQNFSLSLSDLLNEVLPSSLPAASAAIRVEGVTLDSRNIRQGDVFLACPGANHDGRDFIAHALSAGACAVLVEAEGFVSASWSGERGDEPVIPVPLLSSRATSLLPQTGQVVFENLSERLCDMIPTKLTSDVVLIKLTKAPKFDYCFSDTRSLKNAS